MRLVTDDEEWKPPTQVAIGCNLHYIYIAHALQCGELKVAIQACSTSKGRAKMVVLNMAEVRAWLASREREARREKRTLQEHLTLRYHIGRVLTADMYEGEDGLPTDLIPLDIAKQLIAGRDLPMKLIDEAIANGSVIEYVMDNEKMVSETAIVLLITSPNVGDERAIEIEDSGECECSIIAMKMGIDPDVLLKAVVDEKCVGHRNGDLWLVNLADVITWYDTKYQPPVGQPRARYVVVNVKGESDGTTHYDMPFRCRFIVPNVPAIVNNISAQTITEAVDQGVTFVKGRKITVADGIKWVPVEIELCVGTIISMAYLADTSDHTPDEYMALVGHEIAHV